MQTHRLTSRLESRKLWNQSKYSKILFLFFIGFLLAVTYYIYALGWKEISAWIYRVSKGHTIKTLMADLRIPVSSLRYKLWLKFFAPKLENLQIWEYRLENPISFRDFFSVTLTHPTHTDQTITILPGWNMYDIDEYFFIKGILPKWEFLRVAIEELDEFKKDFSFLENRESLEGFLYPDTYRIRTEATTKDIIRVLLSEFDKKIGISYRDLWENAYKELILASIVEREERKTSEQSQVAGILAKRVKEWIPMWADATVCTGYGKSQKDCTPRFIGEVIYEKNPFNTRNKQGYPPTPISNVPLDTWENTREKKESPYYYYLHDSEGNIHYGKTLDDHVNNKRKYLE